MEASRLAMVAKHILDRVDLDADTCRHAIDLGVLHRDEVVECMDLVASVIV